MAYNTNSTSNLTFDTTVTINGITYDLLNLNSPISFRDESGEWNIKVSHSQRTGADTDVTSSEPLVTVADGVVTAAAHDTELDTEGAGVTDAADLPTDVAEAETTSEQAIATSEPIIPSDAESLTSTSDETITTPATTSDGSTEPAKAECFDDCSQPLAAEADVTSTVIETTVTTVSDTEVAAASETTGTGEPATVEVTPVIADETTPEGATAPEVAQAGPDGETTEVDLTAPEDRAGDSGRQLVSWLADLTTFAFDAEADTSGPDADALLPQYADAIADVLGELQACLETHEASSVDPAVTEAVSDDLAGLQAKISDGNDFLI